MKAIPAGFGYGGAHYNDVLPAVINGILHPNVSVVDGAAADTDIAVTNMTKDASVLSCIMFAAGVPSVVPVTVQSDGKIQAASDTTGNKLVVTWIP